MHHLAPYGDSALHGHLLLGGNEEHVILPQGDIGRSPVEDALHVHAQHLQGAVWFHAVHHGTGGESLLGESVRVLNQGTHAVYLVSHLVETRAEYGTLHLHGVLIAGQDGVHAHGVSIGYTERREIKLVHVKHGIFPACLADDTHRLGISVAGETTTVFQQRGKALVLAHLVYHGALHLSVHLHQTVVWSNHYHVIGTQPHIACELSVQDIVIDVHPTHQFAVAIHLDITQRTKIIGSTCHVEGMENGGESRERIGAWCFHLAHHVDGDGLSLPHGEPHLATAISPSQRVAQPSVGLLHRKPAHGDGAETLYGYLSLGTYGLFK